MSKRSIFKFLNTPSFAAGSLLFVWLCAAVDVLTFMPKRAVYSFERARLTADQKLFELWGGLFTASAQLKDEGLLGVKVGVPPESYAEANGFRTPYGQHNYAALLYPGRMVIVEKPEDVEALKPDFLILDKNWPEFTFSGDPRSPEERFVNEPQMVRLAHA